MAAYFFDSSALVKRYVQEVGTTWVRGLTHHRTGNQILLAHITVVEVTSAVARRRGGKTISSAQASSFLSRFRKHVAGRYTILEITPGLLADATTLANRHELRAYDAVQLAAALELNRISQGGTVLVSSDRDLNTGCSGRRTGGRRPYHASIMRIQSRRFIIQGRKFVVTPYCVREFCPVTDPIPVKNDWLGKNCHNW